MARLAIFKNTPLGISEGSVLKMASTLEYFYCVSRLKIRYRYSVKPQPQRKKRCETQQENPEREDDIYKMAVLITRMQAETVWKQYKKDGNDELTMEEVKDCLAKVYDTVDDFDVNEKSELFYQTEARTVTKDEFIKGIMRIEKSVYTGDSLRRQELIDRLAALGLTTGKASIIVDKLECMYDANRERACCLI